ncbi:DcrB-related protein [Ralstonia solanacearum]|uniref:DcrB-related protein n=1 Tax=Ralstonia solanacearum TaxID=305 RepID=UPI00066250D3|nr:DcrB-related protein [Ralstonia solanacearum]
MPEYRMHDAVIDLPAHFKDKTMHLFTVGEAGTSAFTFVVSRAPMEPGDTVDTFATRLVSEMRKTLPRFELKHLGESAVDGEAAREINYQWVSEGTPLHQRQMVVILPVVGRDRTAISFIGTCPKGFTPEAEKAYSELVGSVVLKRPDVSAFVAVPLDSSAMGNVFVLQESSRTLYALPSITDLFRHDVMEMFSGVTFYDAQGVQLILGPAPEGQQAWRRPDGRHFTLWTTDPQASGPLQARLGDVAAVKGMASLPTIEAVQAALVGVVANPR